MTDETDVHAWRIQPAPQSRRRGTMKQFWRRIRGPLAQSRPVTHGLAWLMHAYLRFVFLSSRWVRGSDEVQQLIRDHRGSIFVMWHGQHLLMPVLRPRGLPVAAMFSRSPDAELNAVVAKTFGIEPVRGSGGDPNRQSASKGGAPALIALRSHLSAGTTVFMIADNRHAPRSATLGSLMLSRISGRPVIPIAITTSRRKVLPRTWDRTTINLPFSRVCLMTGEPIQVPADAGPEQMEELRLRLTEGLSAITAEAYQKVDLGR